MGRMFRQHPGFSLLRFRNGLNLIHRQGTRDWDVIHEILFAGGYGKAFQYLRNTGKGVVLDLGGNIGVFSLAAAMTHPAVKIIAYEPGPPNADLFSANLAINPSLAQRIELRREAVGGETGTAGWSFDAANPGGSTLGGPPDSGIAVPVKSFQSLVEEIHEPIVLMKMDIEGSEFEIVERTSSASWRTIPALGMEIHDTEFPGNRIALLEKLEGFGYKVVPDAFSTTFASRK